MGGKFWCIRDVCGLFCVFFTWLLILYAEYVSKPINLKTVDHRYLLIISLQVCCPPRDLVLPPQQSVQRNQWADIPGGWNSTNKRFCGCVFVWGGGGFEYRIYLCRLCSKCALLKGLAFLAVSSHLRTMLTDPGMSKLLSPKNILYACHSVTGAVPKGNATKENIQRMGFEEGQVSSL